VTAFAGRLAREKHGVPLITVHLQPAVFLSAHETPLLHPAMRLLRAMPVWFKRLLFSLPNPVDLFALPKVRRICEANGVRPPRSLWREWWDSPDGVLALFPEWFAKPQPDWPTNLLQWTFPLEDLATEQALKPELQAFLASGERPVVFTPGSANVQASRFFAVAAEAVHRIGCRAVFVTRDPGQVPPSLPASVLTVEYAPFSTLLKHASVFVHHGGIGTLSQGFAAGVPQLVMFMAHDQPDNADRLERLGAGIGLSVRQFTPERVAGTLRQLLQGANSRASAAKCRARILEAPEIDVLMRWIESRSKN
jgi:rhamnosyltransferase subunit B